MNGKTVSRLPRYYRYVRELFGNDVLRISSGELGAMMGLNPSVVKSDLSSIGQFGTTGYGYNVPDLYSGLRSALGITEGFNIVIIGMGELGRAIALSDFAKSRGIRIRGYFDYAPESREINGSPVQPVFRLKDFCLENSVNTAIITTPADLCEEVCSLAIEGGVKGIWNLSGGELRAERAGKDVRIINLNIFDSLLELFGKMKNDI